MEKERPSETRLDKLVKFGQVFALFVSPIAVAFVGLKAQSAVAETSAKKDLVQVAVQVLKEPRRPDDGAIRKWASEVINIGLTQTFNEDLLLRSSKLVLT